MAEKLSFILREVFGDSSSESDGDSVFSDGGAIWESIPEIDGLSICRNFISEEQQSSLISALENEGYLSETSLNQAMRFGDLPIWAIEISNLIHESALTTQAFPSELIHREPLFNQMIINIYQPGDGICAHVDLLRFEDGIGVVSLESSCVMHFTHVDDPIMVKIPVLLTPGSLVLMYGEARYHWKHEINRKPGSQIWDGEEIIQKRRISITFRRLCQTD